MGFHGGSTGGYNQQLGFFFFLSLSLSLSLSFSLSIAICQDCRLGFDGSYFRKTNATNNSHDWGWFVQPIKMVILVMFVYWGLPMFRKLLHFHIMKTNYTLVSSKMANENPENSRNEHLSGKIIYQMFDYRTAIKKIVQNKPKGIQNHLNCATFL